jgi:uncharacterized protein (DUF2461 family)
MSMDDESKESVTNEFQRLGQNLKQTLEMAWESEERKKFQQEIEEGISDLGATLNRFFNEISQTPTGQRVRSGMDHIHEQVRTSNIDKKVQQEIINALKRANDEIEKSRQRWQDDHTENESPAEPADKPQGEDAGPEL